MAGTCTTLTTCGGGHCEVGALYFFNINKWIFTPLLQVFHKNDTLFLGLTDKATSHVCLLIVTVGKMNFGHHFQQGFYLLLLHKFAKFPNSSGEPKGLTEEDKQAKPDICPGDPGLKGRFGNQVKFP